MMLRTPLDKLLDGMRRDNAYSPDALTLQYKYSYVPVFVYGRTQKGLPEDFVMKGFPLIGQGHTFGQQYTMYITKDGEPAAVSEPKHSQAGRIFGEVYIVPPVIVNHLDSVMCNGVHFHRVEELIMYQHLTDIHSPNAPWYCSDCFFYLANTGNEIWKKFLRSPDVKPHYVRHNGDGSRVYRYTRLDEK